LLSNYNTKQINTQSQELISLSNIKNYKH